MQLRVKSLKGLMDLNRDILNVLHRNGIKTIFIPMTLQKML